MANQLQTEEERDEQMDAQDCFDRCCPRKDACVVIFCSRCFYLGRDRNCAGCIFDVDQIYVKLILVMSEILEESCFEKKGVQHG